MDLCTDCKNALGYEESKVFPKAIVYRCIFGLLDLDNITKCTHFKERPKDNSKHFDEAKQTANKGKPPRKQPKKKEDKKRIPFVGEGNLG